jgi:hypothetical protein
MIPLLLAAVAAGAISAPTPPPPDGAKREELVQYATPAFGVCARGTRCRRGELWLMPKNASRLSALVAILSVPEKMHAKQLEKHYKSWFEKNKWSVLGSSLDDAADSLAISAMKWENTAKPELVRAVEVIFSENEIEVREAVGLPMLAKP